LGFASFKNPTNLFGKVTEKSVKDFQKYYGLTDDGIAGKTTLAKIKSVLSTPYQSGKRDKGTVKLKKDLDKLGFKAFKNPTTYYGEVTEGLVKDFQRKHGLKAHGIADEKTLKKIEKLISQPMSKGLRRDDVIKLKNDLKKLGFASFKNPTNLFGKVTEKSVRDFQKYYGLTDDGIAGKTTLAKIKSVLSTPYQSGKRDKGTVKLKKDLDKLGFKAFKNPTTYYGEITESLVKDFQRKHGLKAHGIADEKTLKKIEKLISQPMSKGLRRDDVIKLKNDLKRLGFASFKNPTNLFGEVTEKSVKEFQKYYGLTDDGIAGQSTLSKIKSILSSPLQKGKRHKDTVKLKNDLDILGYVAFKNPTDYFGKKTEQLVKKFQKDNKIPVSGIADKITLKKIKEAVALVEKRTYSTYNITLKQALNMQMKANPQSDKNYAYVSKEYIKNGRVTASALNVRVGPSAAYNAIGQLLEGAKVTVQSEINGWYAISYSYSGWVSATPKDTEYYLNPNNFKNDDKQKFQFLDLSVTSGATKAVLNDYLSGKGTLAKQGQAFIDAGNKHGVNDVYLISHAIHETGNGSSTLASGI